MPSRDSVAVVLMTYGSPDTPSDIPTYLKNVRGGRDPDEETIAEFKRRYSLIGGSPLLRITQAQAAALEKELNATRSKTRFRVVAGMRFAPPFISDVLPKAAEGAGMLVGVIMSPQYSPIIMGGYVKALEQAVEASGRDDLELRFTNEWHLQPEFIRALSANLLKELQAFDAITRERVQVLMTAHSMPRRVIDKEPDYIRQIQETASAVAREAGIPDERWSFCYQSAGHTPEEWLKPDFADITPILKSKGLREVLVLPVQFLADHLETLYDIDIAAREQAEEAGLLFARVPAPNDSPLFINALAAVVSRTLAESQPSTQA